MYEIKNRYKDKAFISQSEYVPKHDGKFTVGEINYTYRQHFCVILYQIAHYRKHSIVLFTINILSTITNYCDQTKEIYQINEIFDAH